MEHSVHKAYQRALLEDESHGTTGPSYMKLFFFGVPRSGKTATRRQLISENFNTIISSTSTGVAETDDVIVRPSRFTLTLTKTVLLSLWADQYRCKWQFMKKEKGNFSLITPLFYELISKYVSILAQSQIRTPLGLAQCRVLSAFFFFFFFCL